MVDSGKQVITLRTRHCRVHEMHRPALGTVAWMPLRFIQAKAPADRSLCNMRQRRSSFSAQLRRQPHRSVYEMHRPARLLGAWAAEQNSRECQAKDR